MKSLAEIKKILKKKSIGIAGAGGLGSNCAVALARVGVGKIVIADFDTISKQNLNRQYFFLEQIGQKKVFALADNIFYINPYIEVEAHDKKLKPYHIKPLYRNCDVIIEAFDLAEMKEMLIETVMEELPDKPLIVGLGMAGWGDNNSIKTRKSGNLYICGDERSEINDLLPALAPRVGIVAHMQANLALELLLNE
ncbi:MAG: sulfur carrier protein ThiS adenylyltransferase ThiF [Bacteroidetes bacterium]|nr:sulfur carrier protein ThiS adenylyltransferase ThiF [Bacteroidota bacterium]